MKPRINFDVKECKNIKEIIYTSAEKFGDNPAFVIKKKNNDKTEYINISYTKLLEDINSLGTEFFSMNL